MKKTELNPGIIRQGDVLMVCTEEAAALKSASESSTFDATLSAVEQVIPREDGRTVLKHGEVTGHAHAFYEPARVILTQSAKRDRHLRVVETAFLDHEEHDRIAVVPGTYDLPLQVEWNDSNEPRAVAD